MVLDVAAVLRDRAGLRFVVVGEGPERAGLQAPDRRGGAAGPLGSVTATMWRRRCSAADIALLTSTWEARALVAQEALLAGRAADQHPGRRHRGARRRRRPCWSSLATSPAWPLRSAVSLTTLRSGPASPMPACSRPHPGPTRTMWSLNCSPATPKLFGDAARPDRRVRFEPQVDCRCGPDACVARGSKRPIRRPDCVRFEPHGSKRGRGVDARAIRLERSDQRGHRLLRLESLPSAPFVFGTRRL